MKITLMKRFWLYSFDEESRMSKKNIFIKIQDGRQNGRLWNNWVKNWGYKIRITLMKHFQLFPFDEES